MSDPPERPASDQGLFLKHFNAGKELFDAGRLGEAQRQLEEAYLLRPRDHKVLNLLGLAYFKQEKYDKAEEVYRKLAAESPDAHTLYYNLGLIYYKLGRLDDSESAFLKALELSKDNLKIHFYLGSIYERVHRYQDAIFQYRQAGANVMVRRMEDRMTPESGPPKVKRTDETARFHGDQVRQALAGKGAHRVETLPFLAPGKALRPISDALLADVAARSRVRGEPSVPTTLPPPDPGDDTRPPQAEPGTATVPPRSGDIVAFFAALKAPRVERTGVSGPLPSALTGQGAARLTPPPRPSAPPQPAAAVETFRLLQPNLLEASFLQKLFVKQGSLYSYSGNLTFWVKEKRPAGQPALVIVTGQGKLLLTDRDREITLLSVESDPVYVQPSNLLACEETLTPTYVKLGEGPSAPEYLQLEGRGAFAVSVLGRTLTMPVSRELPVSLAAPSIILWTGSLTAQLVLDDKLTEILGTGAERPTLVRLEGQGRVLMSQTL